MSAPIQPRAHFAPFIEALERRQLLSASFITQHNLVSDGAVPADHIDKNLKNPWGLAADDANQGPAWVANNGTHKATIYKFADGSALPLIVDIKGAGDNGEGEPTGEIFNQSAHTFIVHQGSKSGIAKFIFSGEDGTLSAWAPGVDQHNTVVVANNSASDAVYKGLAQANAGQKTYLYAADFENGKVDVFDSNFHQVQTFGKFIDPLIPKDYHPFGIQAIDANTLVVTYAKHVPGEEDEAHGFGLGYATIWTGDGHVVRRLQHSTFFNAPWGVTVAPNSWKEFAGDILVGQFGSGNIVAFDRSTGALDGILRDKKSNPIKIDGLWALKFGNTTATRNELFFTAGINDEEDGLFGDLTIHS